jgi:hypothetical protein
VGCPRFGSTSIAVTGGAVGIRRANARAGLPSAAMHFLLIVEDSAARAAIRDQQTPLWTVRPPAEAGRADLGRQKCGTSMFTLTRGPTALVAESPTWPNALYPSMKPHSIQLRPPNDSRRTPVGFRSEVNAHIEMRRWFLHASAAAVREARSDDVAAQHAQVHGSQGVRDVLVKPRRDQPIAPEFTTALSTEMFRHILLNVSVPHTEAGRRATTPASLAEEPVR